MMTSSPPLRLQTRGTLSQDAIYIERPADTDLREALLRGELCYVLAPRQVGKSSLSYRTSRWLRQNHKIHCAHIDLSGKGAAEDTPEAEKKWYLGLLVALDEALGLNDARRFFAQHSDEFPVVRWRSYIRERILGALPATDRLVIFIDEIDYIRALKFNTDPFFTVIRQLWNEQSMSDGQGRLNFCLLGVATPGELVKDPWLTPFNIGHPVPIEDFRREALSTDSLARVLAPLGESASAWLDEVFKWTSGHPYMTFELCQSLINEPESLGPVTPISEYVERCVNETFLRSGRTVDPCLQHTAQRLEQSERKADLLSLYHRLLIKEALRYDGGDPLQEELILSGIAVRRGQGDTSQLDIRNEIFARVFDRSWVQSHELRGEIPQDIAKWLTKKKSKELLIPRFSLDKAMKWFELHPREISIDGYEYLIRSFEGALDTTEEWAKKIQAEQRGVEQMSQKNFRRLRQAYVVLVVLLTGLLVLSWKVLSQAQTIRRLEGIVSSQKNAKATSAPNPPRRE